MPGIQIGDGAIIATKSVVTKMLNHMLLAAIQLKKSASVLKNLLSGTCLDSMVELGYRKIRNLKAICSTDINACVRALTKAVLSCGCV